MICCIGINNKEQVTNDEASQLTVITNLETHVPETLGRFNCLSQVSSLTKEHSKIL